MKAPKTQSPSETPQTPLAILMPDHGTTPTSRKTDKRTHADDLFLCVSVVESSCGLSDSPCNAVRVMSSARGKRYVKNGARGVARRVAHREPMVVSMVRKRVATTGENNAPASTFLMKKYGQLENKGSRTRRDTHPDDASRNRPCVFPDGCDSHYAHHMQQGPSAGLSICSQFAS
jgi:hypothetical protein